jgi:chromosome segregation ATPase
MKKYLILLAIPLMFGCNNAELEKLKAEKQTLEVQASSKDSTINTLVQSFNDVEGNLSSIKEKENSIQMKAKNNNPEMKNDVKARIAEDIQSITDMMAENKNKIASLRKQLKKSGLKVAEFEKMIDHLNQQLAQKDEEIAALNQQLMALNISVSNLNAKVDTLAKSNRDKSKVINNQVDELNKAYYIIGKSKDLITKKIIAKEGGLIGIGSSKKLANDFDNNMFTEIDITKTSSINLGGKKVKLLTTHPSDSYKIEGGEKKAERIVITNPAKFWKASKYMVITAE